jgi:small-conductance mechanosensitive channel
MRSDMARVARAAAVTWLGVAAALSAAAAQGAQRDTAARTAPSGPGAPVVFRHDTLFFLYARLGAFTPEERAAGVSARLERVYRSVGVGADSIAVLDAESHTDLVVGETVLMTVLDGDAQAVGKPRAQVAAEYARAMAAALRAATARTTLKALVLGAVFTVLATLALVLLLKLAGNLFPRLARAIHRWRGTRIPALRIQRFEIVSAKRIADFLIGLVGILRIAVIVVLLYFYVPLVLSFFPWTAPFAGKIVGYVVTPLASAGRAVVGYVPNLFFIAVIVVITRFVLKFIRLFFDALERGAVVLPGFYTEWSRPTYKIVRFLVLAFVVVLIFPYLPGARSDAFKGVSLFLGALLTLGSSSAIANIVAGTVLTYTRAFQVGDRIQIGETVGDVIEKSLLVTRVRTIKNVDITVPNAQVLASHITNYSTVAQTGAIILHTTVTISYDVPWRKVHELLIAAARATEHILETPEPFVLQTSLDDFYVSYEINAYTDQPAAMARTYSELHQNIQDKFNEGGVEIMSPHYRALRDGNQTTVPADHVPARYEPPAFRVSMVPPPAD